MGYLVVIALVLFLLYWAFALLVLYWLVWVPPVLVMLFLATATPLHPWLTRLVFSYFGAGDWAATKSGIDSRLTDSKFYRKIFGAPAALATIGFICWAACRDWEPYFANSLQGIGSTSEIARARTFYYEYPIVAVLVLSIPWAVTLSLSLCIFSRILVARVHFVYCAFSAMDQGVAALTSRDSSITEAYRALGSRQTGNFEKHYKAWVGGNMTEIIKDDSIRRQRLDAGIQSADALLAELTACVDKIENVRGAYQSQVVRLKQMTSVALLASLEEAGRWLVSEQFVRLVDASQWNDVREFFGEIETELGNIEKMANEWAENRGESSTSSERMTTERALRILALPRNCGREDVDRRRKELAKIYHPDRAASDADLRTRNKEAMQEINEACDFLLAARV